MKLLVATLGTALLTANMQVVSAHSQSNLHLTITPRLCVIDVVQDGNAQTVQSSMPDCEAAPPILIPQFVPVQKEPGALFATPLARTQDEAARQQPLFTSPIEGTLTRIANTDPEATGPTPAVSATTTIVTGFALAAAAIVVGVDIAVFELRYSRRLFLFARGLMSSLIKK